VRKGFLYPVVLAKKIIRLARIVEVIKLLNVLRLLISEEKASVVTKEHLENRTRHVQGLAEQGASEKP